MNFFRADLNTQIVTSPKRDVTVFFSPPPPRNFENSALMLIILLFELVFRPFLKIFDTLLTSVLVAKDVAK